MITGSGMMAIAHNGDLTTYDKVKKKYLETGAVFQTDSDTELIINILNKYLGQNSDIILSIRATMGEIDGAYALALMVNGRPFGIRDPHGIRPRIIGKPSTPWAGRSSGMSHPARSSRSVRIPSDHICRR